MLYSFKGWSGTACEFTRKRWRGCWLLLLTFIRVPSFTKTCSKIHNLYVRAETNVAEKRWGFPAERLCKGQRMGGAGQTGWAGGQQTGTMALSDSYPARLQQLPLASDAVFNVDQMQQVFLTHRERNLHQLHPPSLQHQDQGPPRCSGGFYVSNSPRVNVRRQSFPAGHSIVPHFTCEWFWSWCL